jgi:hypothetical protein
MVINYAVILEKTHFPRVAFARHLLDIIRVEHNDLSRFGFKNNPNISVGSLLDRPV